MEDLEKIKKVYGISEECNEPGTRSYWYQPFTYITRGGFGKINLAEWSEGFISYWNNENQKWYRFTGQNLHSKVWIIL
ncbi:kinase-like domain-containing protein [Rhizophagus irregularis DAOM 181602=DAOM 197198]|uniref:Uncharacterized protein n=1 Tax=Rhizophagus irregularis (strain DAOM 181602 / DAOM 197198 / MUCL 43194) TaxID=747089 RepID=A0A2P4PFA2_RHIID|nr:hypothetical protein GLOIN_2v1783321 [Rhizophagus irregularis DAOM 181602=DAOM 197198]POG64064.1 hypothetical protein GLOIN_2v1783321 [Rhizophagus irregularis DAOM 181602=DAOM 197198]GET53991.1 kinase-like domain-containing protein [Rhizophagus irregularis DAOM 181602=DAOM 197198]|eukprot:XP_025170930.1 hypothetical protein GLOIN_2v1783321 [Rhizophagus irregularis DAOM 181602=DAOM 197198]